MDAFYFDIRKAFDSVSHVKLLQILRSIGISGNLYNWFSSYLCGRSQYVFINGEKSVPREVLSGVPQGSILGPKLFLLYITKIENVLNFLASAFFADDGKLYGFFNNVFDPHIFQTDLNHFFSFMDERQLAFAAEKCFVLHYGRNNPRCKYFMKDNVMQSRDSHLDLGVMFDEKLTFSKHCRMLAHRGFAKVNAIFSNFEYKNTWFLLNLFKVFVRPSLEYANEVWSPLFVRDIELIERVQRMFTKRIPGFSHMAYDERFRALNMKKLAYRRLEKDLIMVFKILNGLVDIDCEAICDLYAVTRTRGHSFKLVVPLWRLNLRKNFFASRVVNPWNNLPN